MVVATRLEDGERTVFARGNTGQAVRASSSVPGVFQPVTIGKYHFVDGGVVSPVPVDAARQLGADMVIAVDISNKARGKTPGNMLGALNQSIAIMGQKLGQAELARADVIDPPAGAGHRRRRLQPARQCHRGRREGRPGRDAADPRARGRSYRPSAHKAARRPSRRLPRPQHQACLDDRSRLQKLAGVAELGRLLPSA